MVNKAVKAITTEKARLDAPHFTNMVYSYILPALMVCFTISIVYGEHCEQMGDYIKQPNDILPFLKTREVIPNFNITSHFEYIECGIVCMHHDCTVFAMHENICFIHNYKATGGFNMKTVDEVWFRKGVSTVRGKSHFKFFFQTTNVFTMIYVPKEWAR